MQNFNHSLFLWLASPAQPVALVLNLAKFFAVYAIAAVPVVLALGWLRGTDSDRKVWLEAGIAIVVGLLTNQVIAWFWPQPRPFMLGLGHNLIGHAANSSFPSDHLTGLWAFAWSLALHRSQRPMALALGLLGVPIAWARIYLGVHFPLDMLGALLVAGFGAWLASTCKSLYLKPLYRFTSAIHRMVFGGLIRRGWLTH